jgi:polyisoprenyl-phosphate glycosyltransferase
MSEPLLSIVSPVYRAERTVPELVRRIRAAVEPAIADFEIVLVEDGSPDRSWDAIVRECERDDRVKGIRLSRNFGQHAAITAALAHARGRHVVVMDCDLQDDPGDIPRLYQKALEGFQVVFARKRDRHFGFWKNLTAHAYYRLLRSLSDVRYDPNIGAFSIISRSVVDAFLGFGDYRRGYVIVLDWLGFNRGYIDVEHHERHAGESSYSLSKLFVHALSITLTYSERPLHISIYAGMALSTLAFVGGIGLIIRYFTTNIGQNALGWTSLIVSLFFLCGLILISLGVLGLYVGRIFEQVKRRPIFVVGESRNTQPVPDVSASRALSECAP